MYRITAMHSDRRTNEAGFQTETQDKEGTGEKGEKKGGKKGGTI